MAQLPAPKRRGRPKGSKNKKTLMVEAVRKDILARAGDLMLLKAEEVVQKVVNQALEGCTTSQKLIFDRLLPSQKATEGTNAGGERPQVTINIQGPAEKVVPGVVIEGGSQPSD